jgi:hypothetical protein
LIEKLLFADKVTELSILSRVGSGFGTRSGQNFVSGSSINVRFRNFDFELIRIPNTATYLYLLYEYKCLLQTASSKKIEVDLAHKF